MSLLQSILMGLIQGLTEFLPVSSSGHLAIFKILFDVNTETGLLFDVMLHVGTLVAICIVYYKDIVRLVIEFVGSFRESALSLQQLYCLSVTGYRKDTRNQNRPVMPMLLLLVSARGLRRCRDCPAPERRLQPV